MTQQKNRVWELDALRGFCILCMIAVHLVFDLNEFAGLALAPPAWFLFCQRYGHILFILISGICAQFPARRSGFLRRSAHHGRNSVHGACPAL